MRYDVVIAGAGLAGACAAFHLSRTRSVLVLERAVPPGGASAAAAGLVNPFMGRKARPTWRHREALTALETLCGAAGAPALFQRTGVLRPAADGPQAGAFATTAAVHPGQAPWLSSGAVRERWPDVAAPHGALWIPGGGHVALPTLVRVLLTAAEARGATVRDGVGLSGWESRQEGAVAITGGGVHIPARHLLLALGDGFPHFPAVAALPLHRVKGQTIRLGRPPGLGLLPTLSGGPYLVPEADGLVVGSTFEHDFVSLAPDPALSEGLRTKAARLVPALAAAPVLAAKAGVRVTVPVTRLPLLGPLPGQPNVWVFTGLGARGLLTAPLLAQGLPGYLAAPESIPPEVATLRLR